MGESPDSVRQGEDTGPAEPDEPDEAGEGTEPSGSTVQLRVRDTDSRTTSLRMPVDNATTTLRMPGGSAKKAKKEAAAAEDTADEAPAAPAKPADRPTGADPRLAMRDGRATAGAGLKPGPKPAPAKAAPTPAPEPEAEEPADGEAASDGKATDEPTAARTEETSDGKAASASASVAAAKPAPAAAEDEEPAADEDTPEPAAEKETKRPAGATASAAVKPSAQASAKPAPAAPEDDQPAGDEAEPGAAAKPEAATGKPDTKAAQAPATAEAAETTDGEDGEGEEDEDGEDADQPTVPAGDGASPDRTLMLTVKKAPALRPHTAAPSEKAGEGAEDDKKAADADKGDKGDKGDKAVTASPAEAGGPEPTMKLSLSALKAARKAGAGTVPEPVPEPAPKPAPTPEPEPTPDPEPAPAPKPVPKPAPVPPAPSPLPVPDPAPAPPAPPLPTPENTVEAMEVLAALSRRPMTPFRRAVKRTAIWTGFLSVLLGVLVVVQLLRPLPEPETKLTLARSYTFGGEQLNLPWPAKGQTAAMVVGVGALGSSGPETPAPIASVTKVMNAYLILQGHPLKKGEPGPLITVDGQAARESTSADESKVTLVEGQQLSQYEALEMLMLPSANNVARLLARWDSGSEETFVKKMNDAAAKLGMTNTTYADPAGFNSDTKSTAKDQLKLAEQVMKSDVFRQVVAEPDTNFKGQRIYNTNGLLNNKTGVIGVKTGSSTPAQSCLMWAAVKEIGGVQRMILGVTMGQPATKEEPSLTKAAQPVSQKIITAAQNGLTGQTLAKKGEVVGRVEDGLGGTVPVVASNDLTVAGWSGITAQVTLDTTKLKHSAKAGTQVGTVSAGEGDGRVEVPVTLQSDLAPPSILSRLIRLL
ncbi:D-alanyl-D-alanine carboxypeptidase [Kitasatospora camelliae]|uniref:serine-type D-Ala-D-Ala carboxypeptidase n=1 Tax=Kitasatospora camelliae TaxID=3156397 RepID=A0AAU8K0N3_9ACTN